MSNSILPPESFGHMAPAVKEGLEEVLNDPTINKFFGGADEKLSVAQAGLAAAVAVKMQERLIDNIKESHQRELWLVAGFWKLYKTQMFQRSSSHSDGQRLPEKTAAGSSGRFAELFTWGNVLGGAAVVIVALAFYFTKVTASYKEHWKDAEKDAAVYRQRYDSEVTASEALQVQLGKAEGRADAAEAAVKASAMSADQQAQISKLINQLTERSGELEKEIATSTSEKKFQKMFERASSELKAPRERDANCKCVQASN